MESWKRTMWILWIGVFFSSSGYTMAVPFLPLFLLDLNVAQSSVNLWAGVVHSSGFLVGAIMAPVWGSMADKYGRRKMVIRAGLSLCIVYAFMGLVRNPWELIATRMLHGFVGGFVPASMSIVASATPEKSMGWSLGMMNAGLITGGIMGPLFGGLFSTWFGLRMTFFIAAAIMLVATLAVVIWVKEGDQRKSKEKTNVWRDVRSLFQSRLVLTFLGLLFLFQMSMNMIQPMLTLHVVDLQGGVGNAALSSGIVFSLIGFAGVIASPLWGRTGQNHGYAQTLWICMFASGFIVSLQFFVKELWLFAAVQFIFGLFMAGITPILNTLVVRHTDESFRGRSFGFTTSANQLGATAGPLLAGGISYLLSIQWIFVTTGLILLCAGFIVYVRVRPKELSAGGQAS